MKHDTFTFALASYVEWMRVVFSFFGGRFVGLMWTYGDGFGSMVGQGEKCCCWWWCDRRGFGSAAVGAVEEGRKFSDE